jgi:hypothetical protein
LATDFQEALIAWWGSNAALAAVGLPILHFGTGAGDSYPYAVLMKIGGRAEGRNTGKGYWDTDHWRFSVFDGDLDRAVALIDTVTAQLDTLYDHPLTMPASRQMAFYRTGDDVTKMRHAGTAGVPFIWNVSVTYLSKVSRTRA